MTKVEKSVKICQIGQSECSHVLHVILFVNIWSKHKLELYAMIWTKKIWNFSLPCVSYFVNDRPLCFAFCKSPMTVICVFWLFCKNFEIFHQPWFWHFAKVRWRWFACFDFFAKFEIFHQPWFWLFFVRIFHVFHLFVTSQAEPLGWDEYFRKNLFIFPTSLREVSSEQPIAKRLLRETLVAGVVNCPFIVFRSFSSLDCEPKNLCAFLFASASKRLAP